MSKTILVTLMALVASATAAPYVYGSPFYTPYSAFPGGYAAPAVTAAAFSAPALTAAAYTAPAVTAAYSAPTIAALATPGAALPAPAYPAAVPYPVSGLSGYTYGVQEVAPVAASSPLVVGSPYYAAEYIYGR